MMGVPMSAEEHKAISEKVAARKEAVARSLGKTVEELDSCSHVHHAEHAPDIEAEGADEVDEEAVLTYLRTRQEVISKQRSRIRSLESEVAHLKNERDLAEKKITALREALAKMRSAAQAAAAATPETPETAAEESQA